MTDDLIKRAEEALDGTTDGPWQMETVRTSCGVCHRVGPFPRPSYASKSEGWACVYDDYPPGVGSPDLVANARFIAASRSLVPELTARVQKLVSANRELAMQALAAGGQAQEAYEAQLRAEAALALRVEVKPLVWFEVERGTNGYGKWTAEGYTVRKIEGLFLLDFAGDGKSEWRFITSEAAKAAAQADYEARIRSALVVTPDVAQAVADSGWTALVADAIREAEKAMWKFPQPNYVISKVAEEAGEVVKAAIHCAEGRETAENLRGEMKQTLAMLYRLWVEGDQVHGLPPIAAAIREGKDAP